MDSIFAPLACCLLVVSSAVAQTDEDNFTITSPKPPGFNMTHTTTPVTSSNSTQHTTAASNVNDNTTAFTDTTWDNTTVHPQTPATHDPSLTTNTPDAHTPSFTLSTAATNQTTAGYTSASDTSVITTANSTHTVNTTSESDVRITQGSGLNVSEKNMTIVFSVALGVFAVALVIFTFHRCKHKIQYMHQPFNNSDDPDAFIADDDDDTLVISGGLYDGHPIYDNVQTAPEDQSQFRLEFLH